MSSATCGQCGATVPAGEIAYTPVGSYCRACHVAEQADAAVLERKLVRSIGIRRLIIGLVMLVIGGAILALGVAGGGNLIVIPTGFIIGGIVEIALGATKLSGDP